MHGGLGASGYSPCRAITSAKLSPAACTRTRTWPGPGCGSGVSRTARTSGPPLFMIQMARIRPPNAPGYDPIVALLLANDRPRYPKSESLPGASARHVGGTGRLLAGGVAVLPLVRPGHPRRAD